MRNFLKKIIKQNNPIIIEIMKLDNICPIGMTVCLPSEVIGGNNVLNNGRNIQNRINPMSIESNKEIKK